MGRNNWVSGSVDLSSRELISCEDLLLKNGDFLFTYETDVISLKLDRNSPETLRP